MKPLLAAVFAALVALPALAQQKKQADPMVDRGRYLIQIGGCNGCHTAGYPQDMQQLSEEQWVKKAKTLNTRPPMPWFNLHDMMTSDLRALYRYVRHLGPAGKPAPAYVPPDQTPPQPYVQFPAPPR